MPVITGIAALFGVDSDATLAEVKTAVSVRARALWGLAADDSALQRYIDVVAHLLGHETSLDRLDAAGARDAVIDTLTEMIRRNAETRMTVLFLDNLHWSDATLRDLLGVIVRSVADLPFLLVTAQRPDGDIVWPPPVERPLVLQVPLGPLSIEDSTALVCGILERDEFEHTERTVAEVLDRGGGNPLFLVELASLAATCGDELPGSLRALIAARVDQLPAAQRLLIDNAAVLGTSESVGSLARFAQAMGQEFRQRDLDELAAGGLLDLDGRWWRFRSAVVRDVVYQTLTKRVRAQRHAGVAAVMAERGAAIEDVAHHAATAAELLAELGSVEGIKSSITAHAIQALLEAATAACETGRFELAARNAGRGLDLHPSDPAVERALLLVRSQAELERHNFAQATSDAEEALASALAAGDRIDEGRARRRLGTAAQMQGDLATARREIDAAVELFRADGDERRVAGALRARGFAEVFGGSLDDARSMLGQAMELYHRIDDERGHALTHQNLAWVAFQAGDYEDAEFQLGEARQRFEELNDANGISWADGLLAWVYYFQRRFAESEALATSVEGDARRRADSWAALMMQTLLANLRLWTGRVAEAEQLAERALAGFRDIDDRYGVMQALGPLNRARAALGKKADAKRGVEESIALGKGFGELAMALQGAAGVAMHLGMGEQALTLVEQVLERYESTGAAQHEVHVLMALAHCQVGQVDEAMADIERVDVEDFPFGRAGAGVGARHGRRRHRRPRRRGGGRDGPRCQLLRPRPRPPGGRAGCRPGRRRGGQPALARPTRGAGVVGRRRGVRRHGPTAPRPPGGRRHATSSPLAPGWRRIVDSVVIG